MNGLIQFCRVKILMCDHFKFISIGNYHFRYSSSVMFSDSVIFNVNHKIQNNMVESNNFSN